MIVDQVVIAALTLLQESRLRAMLEATDNVPAGNAEPTVTVDNVEEYAATLLEHVKDCRAVIASLAAATAELVQPS